MTDGLTPHEIQLLNEIDPRSYLAKLGDKFADVVNSINGLETRISGLDEAIGGITPALTDLQQAINRIKPITHSVKLAGNGVTQIVFGGDTPASFTLNAGPYDFSGIVGDITFILTVGDGDAQTATVGAEDAESLDGVTTAELIAVLTRDLSGVVMAVTEGSLYITDVTGVGLASKLTIGAGTANTALGAVEGNIYQGVQGLGGAYTTVTGDYYPVVTLIGNDAAGVGVTITSKTSTGIDITCGGQEDEYDADIIVFIPPAEV
jgi:hypothetical protein